jgi:hypothetical protein
MKRALLIGLLIAAVMAETASAGGWAGSRYDREDCTYNAATDVLYCEAQFTQEEYTTMGIFGPFASCPSGYGSYERTGWLVTTWVGWDYYSGRAPVQVHNLGYGDEAQYEFTWHDYTDVLIECYVP